MSETKNYTPVMEKLKHLVPSGVFEHAEKCVEHYKTGLDDSGLTSDEKLLTLYIVGFSTGVKHNAYLELVETTR